MVRGAKEDPIDFADRCKSAIARAGGLVDRVWDGNLKVNQQRLEKSIEHYLTKYTQNNENFILAVESEARSS